MVPSHLSFFGQPNITGGSTMKIYHDTVALALTGKPSRYYPQYEESSMIIRYNCVTGAWHGVGMNRNCAYAGRVGYASTVRPTI
jgi:hypothetical protein